jgi:type IV fimbrial biogenesis protein FimT
MQVQRSHPVARGLTLIEACITLSIVGILAGTAVPSLEKFQKRRVLEGTASEVLTDVHYARSEAVARNLRLRVSFLGAADGARCLVTHTGTATSCTCEAGGVPQCEAGVSVLKSQSFSAGASATVMSNVGSMVIDPDRGTFSPAGQIRVVQPDGNEIRHVVSMMGRLSTCSPDGRVKGYRPC